MEFKTENQLQKLTQGFIGRQLPREQWNYETLCAVAVFIHRRRPELSLYRDFPDLIVGYNNAVGIENSDVRGYHETMTHFFIQTLRRFVDGPASHLAPVDALNAFLQSKPGQRNYIFKCYTKKLLTSALARQCYIPPDLGHHYDGYELQAAA